MTRRGTAVDPTCQTRHLADESGADPDLTDEGWVQVTHGIEDLIASTDDRSTVAVVCHGGMIDAYLTHILGLPQVFITQPPLFVGDPPHPDSANYREILSLDEFDHLC